MFKVYILYKKKADKINPIDNAQIDRSILEGNLYQRLKKQALIRDKLDPCYKFNKLITLKWLTMP